LATSADAPTVTIDLDLPYTLAPQLGSLLRVDLDSDQFWLRVEDVRATDTDARRRSMGARGRARVVVDTHADVLPASIDLVERLSCEMWTRYSQSEALRLSNLTSICGIHFAGMRCRSI